MSSLQLTMSSTQNSTHEKDNINFEVEVIKSHEGELYETYDKKAITRLMLKVDAVILVSITFIATFEFLDKNTMGYAAVYGLKTDAKLKGNEYSWLSSIFYYAYLVTQPAVFFILPKVPVAKFASVSLILWGGVIMCMAACHNFGGLAAVRFFLGVLEAGILPTFMIIIGQWYQVKEHAIKSAFFNNSFAGIFGGILSYAIGQLNTSLPSWKLMFLIYGAATIVLGCILLFYLPDTVEKAWFLNETEKSIIKARVAMNQNGISLRNKMYNYNDIYEFLRDPKYYIIVIFILSYGITNSGITNFNPLIIQGFGYSQAQTTLLATPQAAVCMVSGVLASLIVLYTKNLRCISWVVSCLPCIAGVVIVHSVDVEAHRNLALAGVYLMGFYNVGWVIMISLVTSNTAGTVKKVFFSINVAVWYAVGNIIGPQFFIGTEAPFYKTGIRALEGSFIIQAITGIMYFIACFVENKRRDRKYGASQLTDAEKIEHGLEADREDLTDFKNIHFLYSY